MYSWVARLRSKMEELNLTQEELAEKLGLTRGAITHYLAGRRAPSLIQIQKLAAVLKVDPAWLQYGAETLNEHTQKISTLKKDKEQTTSFPIPILSWHQAKEFVDLTKLDRLKIKDWLPNFFINNLYWYALRITNDSMTQAGHKKSFYEGDLIIIESTRQPSNGDFVVTLTSKAAEPSFRQYVIDGGIAYLKPLNPQYPLTAIDKKTHIIGVMVTVIRYF